MIYTRFGCRVEIVADEGDGWVAVQNFGEGPQDPASRRTRHVSDLKADGGANEIDEAIKQLASTGD